ncbi:DUF6517 family protein [Haloarchaeobius iranensis]|uniref:Uncharacterized protein n=1 Tax=Haloarchaeobius iranensis TaxID=996166 RepID=A0A1G9V1T6_9EURY|nr:DUF6517 family protein [Haloarchaeobius iranensis]SDM66088.1 hypothetical protein SAMN05192554_105140 [Haloarchaeobius iranensis]
MASRRLATVLAVTLLLTGAGCIGFITGEEPLTYSAERATVADSALGDGGTGYTERSVDQEVIEQTSEDLGNRTVVIENWLARYEKQDDFIDETVGVFAVVSTHEVDVVGEPQNPIANMSEGEVLTELVGQYETSYGDLSGAERTDTLQATMLGEQTDVAVFTTTTNFAGREVEVNIYVSVVKHGDDYVVAIGGHPTQLPDERDNILDLIESIEHSDEE